MKKSMLTLIALSALVSTNIYSSASAGGSSMNNSANSQMSYRNMNHDSQWRPGQGGSMPQDQSWMGRDEKHDNDMRHMMHRDGVHLVTDSQGNIIGGYKAFDRNKHGHNIGLLFTGNINTAPVLVIESNENSGTASTKSTDPNASSTILGYIQHPDYSSQAAGKVGSPSKMITLLQYNKPASNVKIQSYDDENHGKRKNKRNDEEERHHLITLF